MNKNEPILRSLATIEANLLEKLTVETLAGDIHFNAQLGIALDKGDVSTPLGCGTSRHHAGGTAADDHNFHGYSLL